MGVRRLLKRRLAAHDERVKEKRWEFADAQGHPGFDLEDIGEHEDPPAPVGSRFSWWGSVFGSRGFFGWGASRYR